MGRTQAGRPASRKGLEQARHFDFWLGEWDVAWPDGAATSSVYVDFDDKVIVESWDGRPSSEVQGMSVSLFDEESGVWRYTWVDSEGKYVAMSGGFDGDGMELRSESGEPLRRARWFDIQRGSFSWTMEHSHDDGRTWKLVWDFNYRRVL